MAVIPGFLGPSQLARARSVVRERTINLYPEVHETGTTKSNLWLNRIPAYIPYVILDPGPIRAIFWENGRGFAVSGGYFYEFFANQTCIVRGQVATNSKAASICSNGLNGFQLFVVSGGYGYIFNLVTNTFTQITATAFPFPALWGEFVNAYFVVLSSDRFQISNVSDGLLWDGLDVAQMSQTSDLKVAMRASHTELWFWGGKRTEVWSLTLASRFPFTPNQATPIDHGIDAPDSPVLIDNTVIWVGRDEKGHGIVYKAAGYTPQRISNFALEDVLNRLPRIDDAVGWAESIQGHLNYHLYLPQAETQWVYDAATNLWHEEAILDAKGLTWKPHIGRCHAYGFGKHLVGDRLSGCIYSMELDRHKNQLLVVP